MGAANDIEARDRYRRIYKYGGERGAMDKSMFYACGAPEMDDVD